MEIQLEVTPQFRDYLRFQFYGSYLRLRIIVWIALALLLAFLIVPLLPLRWEGDPSLGERYRGAMLGLSLPAIMFVLMPISIYFGARTRWKRAVELSETRRYGFSDSGLTVQGETFNSRVDWSNIVRAQRGAGLLLLFTAQQVAYYFPLQHLREQGALSDLVELVRRHVRDTRSLSGLDIQPAAKTTPPDAA